VASVQEPDSRPDGDFKLSITRALADQLHSALDQLTPAPLTDEALAELQARPGVYSLFVNGLRVYIGKADKSLPVRLAMHMRKLSGRSGFARTSVAFICLYVDEDLEASAPEKLLIKAYHGEGGAPWNKNGFGNNDPGRNRDTSRVKANHFDALYPINLEFPVGLDPNTTGKSNVLACLDDLKSKLPYVLRFARKGHAGELGAAQVVTSDEQLPVRQWITLLIEALPAGWLATALPGYVILYKEQNLDRYESAVAYWFKGPGGRVHEHVGQGRHDPVGAIDERGDDDVAAEIDEATETQDEEQVADRL
jgi:hypothetical protein